MSLLTKEEIQQMPSGFLLPKKEATVGLKLRMRIAESDSYIVCDLCGKDHLRKFVEIETPLGDVVNVTCLDCALAEVNQEFIQ